MRIKPAIINILVSLFILMFTTFFYLNNTKVNYLLLPFIFFLSFISMIVSSQLTDRKLFVFFNSWIVFLILTCVINQINLTHYFLIGRLLVCFYPAMLNIFLNYFFNRNEKCQNKSEIIVLLLGSLWCGFCFIIVYYPTINLIGFYFLCIYVFEYIFFKERSSFFNGRYFLMLSVGLPLHLISLLSITLFSINISILLIILCIMMITFPTAILKIMESNKTLKLNNKLWMSVSVLIGSLLFVTIIKTLILPDTDTLKLITLFYSSLLLIYISYNSFIWINNRRKKKEQ